MRICNLKTLHQKNPVGIDQVPYFSWVMESDLKNTLQQSYQIVVMDGQKTVWNTGVIMSQKQSFVKYEGEILESCKTYIWSVTVCDNYGNVSSEQSEFETAFLDPNLWKAKWVESTIPRVESEQYLYGTQPPAVLFSKEFSLKGEIKRARLYATSYGVYRPLVNGIRPDDREFAPEHTAYRDILYYQTYDVGGMLKKGKNQFTMYVGDGWYLCPQSRPVMDNFHSMPAVLFQFEIEYSNGTKEYIFSDGNEECCTGPIQFSDIFRGEKLDATVPFGKKQQVRIADYGYVQLTAQPMPPVRPMKLLPAVEMYTSPKGESIVDFGQLLCGRARIHVDAPKGTEVIFEYFEVPDKEGNYFNSMYADQKDIFVSNGEPCEYEAMFTFHGFRYIRVTGLKNAKKYDFTAVLLTTEKENTGIFSCSDERMNRLYQNIRWSQANNMLSIPTDCPSREKAGFTGDILIYAKTALLNEDVTPFLTSYMKNLAADQTGDGVVPIVVPFNRSYERLMKAASAEFGDTRLTGVAGWSDAAVMVPYWMYQITGNTIILEEFYETMKRWCDYVIWTAQEKRGRNNLAKEIDQYLWNTGFHFGEWLIPSQPEASGGFEICKESAVYTAPIFGYNSVRCMAEIAQVLGKEEAQYFSETAKKMKHAIQEGLMQDGEMPKEFMGAYVLAIALDLVPDKYQKTFADKLVSMLEANHRCLDTGFLATPYLLDALVKIGRRDLAISVLWQDKQPSWLFEVDHGATAIWESWFSMEEDGTPKVTSYDHYAFGCVDDWVFRNIAGINWLEPGFKHFRIEPEATAGGHLSWCKRTFISEYGEIEIFWTKEKLKVRIPCNTMATVVWRGEKYEVGSGSYEF